MRLSTLPRLRKDFVRACDTPHCRLARKFAKRGRNASEAKTGDDIRQSLNQGLAFSHGLYTYFALPSSLWLSIPIWK